MTLVELGVGPGDEVILRPCCGAGRYVMYVGATPVIIDVDPRTWNISPAAIAALTPSGGDYRFTFMAIPVI